MVIHIFHLANKCENSYTGTMNELTSVASHSLTLSFFSSARSCIQIFKIIVVSRNSNRHENELCDDFLVIFGKLARWCSTSDENQQTYKHWEIFFSQNHHHGQLTEERKKLFKEHFADLLKLVSFHKKIAAKKN